MNLTINEHVRSTIRYDLPAACDLYDAALAQNDGSLDARIRIEAAMGGVVRVAARILSHASRGRRYPNLTEKEWIK